MCGPGGWGGRGRGRGPSRVSADLNKLEFLFAGISLNEIPGLIKVWNFFALIFFVWVCGCRLFCQMRFFLFFDRLDLTCIGRFGNISHWGISFAHLDFFSARSDPDQVGRFEGIPGKGISRLLRSNLISDLFMGLGGALAVFLPSIVGRGRAGSAVVSRVRNHVCRLVCTTCATHRHVLGAVGWGQGPTRSFTVSRGLPARRSPDRSVATRHPMARDGPDCRIAPDSTGSHLPAPPDLPACRPCFA